jgi:hypothetical protein
LSWQYYCHSGSLTVKRELRHAPSTPAARGLVDDVGMWTHQVQRLVRRPIADVRMDIARIVDATWRRVTTVATTEHHGRRADWISDGPGSDDIDIVITWSLTDLDDATYVVVTLDEFERGPDPIEGLEQLLDVLATSRRVAHP